MRYSPNVSGTVSPRPARADPGNSKKEKKMKIHCYTTAAELRTEIRNLKARHREVSESLEKFWKPYGGERYGIARPRWVIKAEALRSALFHELEHFESQLVKIKEREACRAQQREISEDMERCAAVAREEAAVETADPEKLWEAVNAASGGPALSRAFIGSAHVRRIALRLGVQSPA